MGALARGGEAGTPHWLSLDDRGGASRGFLRSLGAAPSLGQIEMVRPPGPAA